MRGVLIAVIVIITLLLITGVVLGVLYSQGLLSPKKLDESAPSDIQEDLPEPSPQYTGAYTWAVNTAGSIYRIPIDGTGEWAQITGTADNIAVSKSYVWTIRGNDLYRCAKPCNSGSWQKVLSGASAISALATSEYVYYLGVASVAGGNDIYIMKEGDSVGTKFPGGLTNIAVGPTSVWATNSDRQVLRCAHPCDGTGWQLLDGLGTEISASSSGAFLLGIESAAAGGLVPWRRDETANSPWRSIAGGATDIAAGKDYLWAIESGGGVKKCKIPCDGTGWTSVPGGNYKAIATERFRARH